MKCSNCGNKLLCQDSRPVDRRTTIREYGCHKCKKVYASIEELDKEPLDKEAQKKRIQLWKERVGEKSTS